MLLSVKKFKDFKPDRWKPYTQYKDILLLVHVQPLKSTLMGKNTTLGFVLKTLSETKIANLHPKRNDNWSLWESTLSRALSNSH